MRDEKTTTLWSLRKGEGGEIVELPEDPMLRSQCIRLGIGRGETFTCIGRLPGGTIIVETHRQEIALGGKLARTIQVVITSSRRNGR